MIRLGLFGGTFDPVHYGHLRPVEAARVELELESILILPNPLPPHKQDEPLTPYAHRKAMLRLALTEFPALQLADFEEQAIGPAYTTDTLQRVIASLPPGERELWLIIGADSFVEFPRWRDPEAILRQTRIAVLPRPGVDLDNVPRAYRERVRILNTPLFPISATDIRTRLKSGKPTADLLPPAVMNYIRQHRLYSIGAD
jgi:nicotinate-nucleotide adenylyltransferase